MVISLQNKVAIYCRLSEEDRNKKNKTDESGSIQNQKRMLIDYAIQQGWDIYNIYVDDDYAGSDRNRPAFNQMITDAHHKKFNIVLCKTQSRFTRELEIVELYIHNLFPQWGIRFVSIVDNIDTDIVGNKKTRQINGLINEWYLEDMSESIKAALDSRKKAGFFIGSFAPYGYKKDPDIKGHLIPDEEVAWVVQDIFRMYVSGMGRTAIARNLNSRKILSPSAYKESKRIKSNPQKKLPITIWKYSSVSDILNNEIYIGNLVQGKYYHPTYKSKHSIPASKDKWIRVEGTHEPLIDMDTWILTREIWDERSKPCYVTTKPASVFSGKVECAYCGLKTKIAYTRHSRYFRCSTREIDKNVCNGVTVFETTIAKAVQREFKRIKSELLDEDYVQKNLSNASRTESIKRLEEQISSIQKDIDDADRCVKNLYIDKLKGIISESQFMSLMSQFSDEKAKKEEAKKEIETQLSHFQSQIQTAISKREVIKRFSEETSFTREMSLALIDRIIVGGTRKNREITIIWKF